VCIAYRYELDPDFVPDELELTWNDGRDPIRFTGNLKQDTLLYAGDIVDRARTITIRLLLHNTGRLPGYKFEIKTTPPVTEEGPNYTTLVVYHKRSNPLESSVHVRYMDDIR